jgi:hypothetical protein
MSATRLSKASPYSVGPLLHNVFESLISRGGSVQRGASRHLARLYGVETPGPVGVQSEAKRAGVMEASRG